MSNKIERVLIAMLMSATISACSLLSDDDESGSKADKASQTDTTQDEKLESTTDETNKDPEPLQSPAIDVSAAELDSVVLSWEALDDAVTYILYRQLDDNLRTTIYTGTESQFVDSEAVDLGESTATYSLVAIKDGLASASMSVREVALDEHRTKLVSPEIEVIQLVEICDTSCSQAVELEVTTREETTLIYRTEIAALNIESDKAIYTHSDADEQKISYVDSTTTPGMIYFYHAVSIDGEQRSEVSTQQIHVPPNAPELQVGSVTLDHVELLWQSKGDNLEYTITRLHGEAMEIVYAGSNLTFVDIFQDIDPNELSYKLEVASVDGTSIHFSIAQPKIEIEKETPAQNELYGIWKRGCEKLAWGDEYGFYVFEFQEGAMAVNWHKFDNQHCQGSEAESISYHFYTLLPSESVVLDSGQSANTLLSELVSTGNMPLDAFVISVTDYNDDVDTKALVESLDEYQLGYADVFVIEDGILYLGTHNEDCQAQAETAYLQNFKENICLPMSIKYSEPLVRATNIEASLPDTAHVTEFQGEEPEDLAGTWIEDCRTHDQDTDDISDDISSTQMWTFGDGMLSIQYLDYDSADCSGDPEYGDDIDRFIVRRGPDVDAVNADNAFTVELMDAISFENNLSTYWFEELGYLNNDIEDYISNGEDNTPEFDALVLERDSLANKLRTTGLINWGWTITFSIQNDRVYFDTFMASEGSTCGRDIDSFSYVDLDSQVCYESEISESRFLQRL